jgi:16S rRNA (adenine1518-N6/adenine1519-N6)-dimethyltransferase
MTSPRTLLKAWNLRARKHLGQHFLADPSTADMIVARSNLSPSDIVLEIGAGLGALTIPVARAVAKVVAVEKDAQLVELLQTELLVHNINNVELRQADFLRCNLHGLAEEMQQPLVVMGNLPYRISTQVLLRLVAHRDLVERAVLMFQKELAERLKAGPGKKDYGRLTVTLGYCAEITSIARVEAGLFFPQPGVDSEVLEIKFTSTPSHAVVDESLLFKVVKAAFGRRRKTLKNALRSAELAVPADLILPALEQAGIDPRRRAETLTVSEYVALTNALTRLAAGSAGNGHWPSLGR